MSFLCLRHLNQSGSIYMPVWRDFFAFLCSFPGIFFVFEISSLAHRRTICRQDAYFTVHSISLKTYIPKFLRILHPNKDMCAAEPLHFQWNTNVSPCSPQFIIVTNNPVIQLLFLDSALECHSAANHILFLVVENSTSILQSYVVGSLTTCDNFSSGALRFR